MLAPIAVREVMETDVQTISPEASVRAAATRLFEEGIGSLVVCRSGTPVGIVTDVDVTRLVSENGDAEATTVADLMSEDLVTIEAEAAIEAAAQRMRDHVIKRLPVVDDGELVGIVTTTDLSNYLPHLVRLGRQGTTDKQEQRERVRADTAYERDDWTLETTGDMGTAEDLAVGQTISFSKRLTEADVEAFAEASGDTNRLHLDEEYAAKSRFGERIAHGTLVAGTISAALARLPGLVVYLSQDTSYLGPVGLGDRVTAECTIVESVGTNRYRLTTEVLDDGETVVDGEAVVLVDDLPV